MMSKAIDHDSFHFDSAKTNITCKRCLSSFIQATTTTAEEVLIDSSQINRRRWRCSRQDGLEQAHPKDRWRDR